MDDPHRLRVAFDVTPLAGSRTGVGNLVAGFAHELRRHRDLELVFYATTARGRDAIKTELSARIPPLPARVLRAMWMRSNWPPVEMWSGNVDVVHGMNYVVPPTRSGASLVSVHDLTVVHFPEMCTADTLQYPTLLKRAFARGAQVHVDSSYVGEELLSWSGLDADRVHVVKPGLAGLPPVDAANPLTGSGPLAERLPAVIGGKPYLLALGTVEPRKDYLTLVRAFSEIAQEDAELQLVIAGGDGWGAAELSAAISLLPPSVTSRISRLGYVSEAEKAWLLQNARVLAYPSVYEGFGLPPLEAMQYGTPVVSTRVGSLPEVLGDAAVFVPAGDSHALAEQLLRVHINDDIRGILVSAGHVKAASYTWERAGTEMASLYHAIASSVGARGASRPRSDP